MVDVDMSDMELPSSSREPRTLSAAIGGTADNRIVLRSRIASRKFVSWKGGMQWINYSLIQGPNLKDQEKYVDRR